MKIDGNLYHLRESTVRPADSKKSTPAQEIRHKSDTVSLADSATRKVAEENRSAAENTITDFTKARQALQEMRAHMEQQGSPSADIHELKTPRIIVS